MNQLRWDPTLREWVAYATHRQDRTFLPPEEYCPLCPTKPGGFPTEVPREHYDIVVFENKFPSFSPNASAPDEEGSGLTPTAPGRGICEVVLYSDHHDATLATLSERRIGNLIEVWADTLGFLERYRSLVEALLRSSPVQGFCYTQLTDVEQEINGLLTYDRKPKVDPARVREINDRR